jgi:hypothetical protein
MPLPPRPFHSLGDIANRWSVVPIDLVGWAAEGLLALSIAAPAVKTNASKVLCDLVEIAGTDVLPLFRSDGAKVECVNVRRLRPHGETEWHWITAPTAGVTVSAPDVLILRTEVQRFEKVHGLGGSLQTPGSRTSHRATRRRPAGPGAPPRYDWDNFFVAITRRVYDQGLPPSQNELVREMLDWFESRHDQTTPDESTVRRKVALVWRELTRT